MIALICNVTTDYLINNEEPLTLSVRNITDEEYNLLSQIIEYFKENKSDPNNE